MDVVDPETQEGAVAGAAEGGRTQRRPRVTGKGASNSSIKNRRNVINILNGSNVLGKAIPISPSDADDVAAEAKDGEAVYWGPGTRTSSPTLTGSKDLHRISPTITGSLETCRLPGTRSNGRPRNIY